MATLIASKVAKKLLADRAEQYEPPDPHYEYYEDSNGKKRKRKRPVPPGLSKRDAKILRKIRKRAHHLDKGMNLCGFKVGYTFFVGIVPGAGDIAAALLNYTLVYKPSKKLDLPSDLQAKMLFNNAVSVGVGIIPVAGDIFMAAWKANSRNAHLVEAYLTIRGQEHLASLNQAQSVIPAQGAGGATAAAIRRWFLGDTDYTSMEAGQGASASGTSTPLAGAGVAPAGTGAGVGGAGTSLGGGQKVVGNGQSGAGTTSGAAPMVGVQGAQQAERKKGFFGR